MFNRKEISEILDEIREVPVDYELRERMRMSNHPLNVWRKTGPNTECNNYLKICRPINRIKSSQILTEFISLQNPKPKVRKNRKSKNKKSKSRKNRKSKSRKNRNRKSRNIF
jgi:hypothetical protein